MRITAVLPLLPSVGLFPRRTATARRRTVPFDIVITRGHIIDGTGSPWYSGDIGIREGHIASIGVRHRASRRQTIDAHGMVVAPGFIDMLGQSDLSILIDPRLPSKIYHGITIEITGEGESVAPLDERMIAADHATYEHYVQMVGDTSIVRGAGPRSDSGSYLPLHLGPEPGSSLDGSTIVHHSSERFSSTI